MVRGIKYNEGGNPLNYESVEMCYTEDGERKTKVFDTGNFVKDWFDALKWFIQGDFGEHLSNSSSVDHFIMDGGHELYVSVYLKFNDDGEPYLYYEWDDRGLELFVPKEFVREGMKPTWEEYKLLCE